MGLFRKNKTKNEQIVNEKSITETSKYHKCEICGANMKDKIEKKEKCKGKYLDGQEKISLTSKIEVFYCCDKCGYIYEKNENIKQPWIKDEVAKIVQSKEYQSIREDENIPEPLKTLLLSDMIKTADKNLLKKLNQLWLDYYVDIKNEDKIQEYLLKRIEEVPNGFSFTSDIYAGELSDEFYRFAEIDKTKHLPLHINMNAVLTDLYRRSGQFDKAKEHIAFAFSNYNVIYSNNILRKYYEYQMKLIEENDKRYL